MLGLSESLQIELADHDIGVSVLCPGAVATGIVDHALANAPTIAGGRRVADGTEEFFTSNRPVLAAGAQPDDVGRAVLNAASETSSSS